MQYDLPQQVTETARHLEHALTAFTHECEDLSLRNARVFALPPVEKGAEHAPLSYIPVHPYSGREAETLALRHFTRLFIQQQSEQTSSKAAVRLPGALCYEVDAPRQARIRQHVEIINALKRRLAQIITVDSALTTAQRFEWVHRHVPGLITLSAYRQITLIEQPATLRFGWANKQVVKNFTRSEVLAMLKKTLNAGRAAAPLTREQWLAQVTQEYNDIAALPEHARLKIRRPVKVQPLARVWYSHTQRQKQYACPSPLLVICRQGTSLPDIGELADYDAQNIHYRHRPQPQPLSLLIPRLHLWRVDD